MPSSTLLPFADTYLSSEICYQSYYNYTKYSALTQGGSVRIRRENQIKKGGRERVSSNGGVERIYTKGWSGGLSEERI
ncbi:uncharacterized protein LACBIDRAFT_302629 [Laccaria bicolor S238N-H82]|uniref:Predicted protein n=1 Tax=Laccaria bicolor (strain S238N-H82 / ATCC MYA-4686) TaxID=486041 RepID=B0DI12_LACBS|nr:uncharacterized protein LACBIDRAFT_302629 [Laccaria bicolor S238N-H82]EDR05926.1 predicted protein [Laccaria bicolor S238N-H82]|eukprot:XP_001883602.1 predicted protein [Laccaria bicolor S238N-H82]